MPTTSLKNGILADSISQAERLKKARAIIGDINIPPLQPGEKDITMDEIVQECHIVRRKMYREQRIPCSLLRDR